MRRGKLKQTPEGTRDQAAVSGSPAAVNKTKAIQTLIEEWAQADRECMPKALSEELKRRYPSEDWSLAYIYSIKSKLKKERLPPAPPLSHASPVSQLAVQDAAALVLAVKNLAKQAGGLDRLKRLIEALQNDG